METAACLDGWLCSGTHLGIGVHTKEFGIVSESRLALNNVMSDHVSFSLG